MEKTMDKRYQVFVSSTYDDLIEERLEVMKALIELDCIPCGMEYFPAANEDQWTFIKKLIDMCDYYVVIIGGRYGSEDPTGKSYTQKEYEYAISKEIPTIGFIQSDRSSLPEKKKETDEEKLKKLEDFISIVRSKLCKDWSNAYELGGVVSRSLIQLIKSNPRNGWIRADKEIPKEIINLHRILYDYANSLRPESIKIIDNNGKEYLGGHADNFYWKEVTRNICKEMGLKDLRYSNLGTKFHLRDLVNGRVFEIPTDDRLDDKLTVSGLRNGQILLITENS